MGRRVLMVVAPRAFADDEYVLPRAAFEAAGCEVSVASSSTGPIRGAAGTWARADRTVATVRAADFDAVVLVGGAGSAEYVGSRAAHRLCRDAVAGGKVLAAICIAPAVLAAAGVLKGLRATCWPEVREAVARGGATLVAEPVVACGRVVTADGPSSATAFGAAVLKALATS